MVRQVCSAESCSYGSVRLGLEQVMHYIGHLTSLWSPHPSSWPLIQSRHACASRQDHYALFAVGPLCSRSYEIRASTEHWVLVTRPDPIKSIWDPSPMVWGQRSLREPMAAVYGSYPPMILSNSTSAIGENCFVWSRLDMPLEDLDGTQRCRSPFSHPCVHPAMMWLNKTAFYKKPIPSDSRFQRTESEIVMI